MVLNHARNATGFQISIFLVAWLLGFGDVFLDDFDRNFGFWMIALSFFRRLKLLVFTLFMLGIFQLNLIGIQTIKECFARAKVLTLCDNIDDCSVMEAVTSPTSEVIKIIFLLLNSRTM